MDYSIDLRPFVKYITDNHITEEEALKLLKETDKLGKDDKNLVYRFCFPRELPSYGLPDRIRGYRSAVGRPEKGTLAIDPGEVTLLIEAERTQEYGKFMRHLFHSFIVNPNLVSPIEGKDCDTCPICGKKVYGLDSWNEILDRSANKEESVNKEYLAFSSKKSSILMCLDCLVHLNEAFNVIKYKISSDYLNNSKEI